MGYMSNIGNALTINNIYSFEYFLISQKHNAILLKTHEAFFCVAHPCCMERHALPWFKATLLLTSTSISGAIFVFQ